MQDIAAIDALLTPVNPDQPCGEDLRYDDRLAHLFDMPKYEKRQDFSGARKTEAVEAPAWSAIAGDLSDALARTRDLRLWILQLRVWCGLDGIDGAIRGLALIHDGIERYWDELYPGLDPTEPDPDLKMIRRLGALRCLVDPKGFVGELRRIPLVEGGVFGKIGLRQIDLASGRIKASDPDDSIDAGRIEAAFRSADPNALTALSVGLANAIRKVNGLRSLLNRYIEAADDKIDLAALRGTFQQMQDAVTPYVPAGNSSPEDSTSEGNTSEESTPVVIQDAATPIGRADGGLQSRDDVITALDDILRYYQSVEPSSPIPLLLKRTKRLVRKDFIELIEDLAPSAVKQVLELGGVEGKQAAEAENGS